MQRPIWLGYSPFLQPFTAKPRTMEDLKPEAERIGKRRPPCQQCPEPDDRLAPDDRPMNLLEGLAALSRLHQPDLADFFARTEVKGRPELRAKTREGYWN